MNAVVLDVLMQTKLPAMPATVVNALPGSKLAVDFNFDCYVTPEVAGKR